MCCFAVIAAVIAVCPGNGSANCLLKIISTFYETTPTAYWSLVATHNHTMLTVLLYRLLSRWSAYEFQFTATDVSNAVMPENTPATVLTCLHGSLGQVYSDHVSLVRGVQLVPPVVAALLSRTRLPAWSTHPEHRSGEVQMVLFQIQIFTQIIIFPFSDGMGCIALVSIWI